MPGDMILFLIAVIAGLCLLLTVNFAVWVVDKLQQRHWKKEVQRREIERQSPRVLRKVFPDEMDIELALEIVNRREIA